MNIVLITFLFVLSATSSLAGFNQEKNFSIITVQDIKVFRDVQTGLLWSEKSEKRMAHEDAEKYCASLSGMEGVSWRLPTKKEYLEAEQHSIRNEIPNMKGYYWASDLNINEEEQPIYAWVFDGYQGRLAFELRTVTYAMSVRCVGNY